MQRILISRTNSCFIYTFLLWM